ncbi:PTS system, lactose-specific IIBC component [Streptococcus infantarius subsp. infantarius]|nr:PTS system, lactose-specific IIBC component [Streptococcus infantarius subsp. infantarius]
MNKLIELIEKGKPFFERISRNKYLRAIRDGKGAIAFVQEQFQ